MDSETVQVLLQDAYMFMNPNLSLKLLVDDAITFEEEVVLFHILLKFPWRSWWSLEHSTNAAKNGSFLKPSLAVLFLGENSSQNLCIFLAEFGGFLAGGGNGSSWLKEELFFLEICCFGIPGMCSQENGTPFLENWKALKGESWSCKESDPNEEWGEGEEETLKIGVENLVALWPYLGFLVVGEVAIEILQMKRAKGGRK